MQDNKDKKNPFSVPDGYFQNFNAEIMNKLPEKSIEKKPKVIPLWKHASRWVSAAAILTAVVFIGLEYMNSGTGSINNAKSMTPSKVVAVENVSNNNNDYEYYEFIQDEAARLAYRDVLNSNDNDF